MKFALATIVGVASALPRPQAADGVLDLGLDQTQQQDTTGGAVDPLASGVDTTGTGAVDPTLGTGAVDPTLGTGVDTTTGTTGSDGSVPPTGGVDSGSVQPNGSAPPLPLPVPEGNNGYVSWEHVGGGWDDHGYAFPPVATWNDEHQYWDFGQQYQPHHGGWVQAKPEFGWIPLEQFEWQAPQHDWWGQDHKTYQHAHNYMVDMAKWKFDKHIETWGIDQQYKPDWDFHWGQIHYATYYMEPSHDLVWHLHHAIHKFKTWYHEQWQQHPQQILVLDQLCDEAWFSFSGIYNHFVSWPIYETMQGWYHHARPHGIEHCQDVWQVSHHYYTEGPQAAISFATDMFQNKYSSDPTQVQEFGSFFQEMQDEFPLAAQQEAAPEEDIAQTSDESGAGGDDATADDQAQPEEGEPDVDDVDSSATTAAITTFTVVLSALLTIGA